MLNIEKRIPSLEDMDSFLGLGLSREQWKNGLESRNFEYDHTIKYKMMKLELDRVKSEIISYLTEDNFAPKGKDNAKSNSVPTILKRMKGEDWMTGMTNEKKQRLHSRTLLGSDTKYGNPFVLGCV